LSTSKKLSELFANLENEVEVEDAVHFSVRLIDQDEVPSEIKEKAVNQNTSSIPTEAVEMMHYGPFLCKVAVYMCIRCGTRFLYVKFYRWKNDGAEFVPTLILQSDHKIVDES